MPYSQMVQRARRYRFLHEFEKVLKLLKPGWEGTVSPCEEALLRFERGKAYWERPDYMSAMRDFWAAYQLVQHVEDREDAAWIHNAYADIVGDLGERERACTIFAKAYMEYAPTGIVGGFLAWNWGRHLVADGKPDLGIELMQRGYNELLKADSIERVCVVLDLAEALLGQDRGDDAFVLLKEVEALVAIHKPNHHARFEAQLERACWEKRPAE